MNNDVPGWMSIRDLEVLSYLSSCVPENGNILEIGPFLGRSTSALIAGKKDSVALDVVDTFTGIPVDSYCADIKGSREKFDQLRSIAIETGDWEKSFRLCQADNIEKMNVVRCDSQTFETEKRYNMTFIDSDHSFQSVFKDITKFINDYGILVGDDFILKWPGVPKAVIMSCMIYNKTLVVPNGSKIWILLPSDVYWKNCIKDLL